MDSLVSDMYVPGIGGGSKELIRRGQLAMSQDPAVQSSMLLSLIHISEPTRPY